MAENDQEIGFGKPPKHSQFKKGTSGNPKGRPKGTRNLATVLERALKEKVIVNENGKRRTVTKLDAAVTQLVNKAASGDLTAMRQLMMLAGTTDNQPKEQKENELTETDTQVMQSFLKRLGSLTEKELKD